MPSRRTELFRRAVRWSLSAALFALTPKCVLCVITYAGLGAALGLGGPEICGASAGATAPWAISLAWLGVAGALATFGFFASCRHVRSVPEGRISRPGATGTGMNDYPTS